MEKPAGARQQVLLQEPMAEAASHVCCCQLSAGCGVVPELGPEGFAPGRLCWRLRQGILLPRARSRASTSPDGCRCGFSDETQPPNACNLL